MRLAAIKWVHNGLAIGYHDGLPYFIKGLLPGETGDCDETKRTVKFGNAILKKLHDSSPDRIEADCPAFPQCGGCSFRHITYTDELKLKKQLLLDSLSYSIDLQQLPEIEILSAQETNYRNNVQLKVINGELGFFQTGTNEIIPLPENGCLNLANELNEFILENKKGLSLSAKKEIRLRLTSKGIVEYSDAVSEFKALGFSLTVPKNGFYQINRFLIDPWLKKIQEYSPAVKYITEFFSGAGIISLALKEHYEHLTGFELDQESVKFAERNAKTNDVKNTKFIVKNLYEQKPEIPSSAFWIFNPPRNGLNKLLISQIQDRKPEHILYSSCNYTTLARDLKELASLYKIEKISMFDFFPRTPYFETLVKLQKS